MQLEMIILRVAKKKKREGEEEGGSKKGKDVNIPLYLFE